MSDKQMMITFVAAALALATLLVMGLLYHLGVV